MLPVLLDFRRKPLRTKDKIAAFVHISRFCNRWPWLLASVERRNPDRKSAYSPIANRRRFSPHDSFWYDQERITVSIWRDIAERWEEVLQGIRCLSDSQYQNE